jgi:hypothetical protein
MRQGDLSLTVSQRRLACVLDPALALGQPAGPVLALKLAQVLEPWLTRSFWQAVDSSELIPPRRHKLGAGDTLLPNDAALSSWIALRNTTDAGSWPLRWVGDNLPESQVKDSADASVVERCELLMCTLLDRAQGHDVAAWATPLDPVLSAMDAVALSACLDGAMVLTLVPSDASGEPWPVQALARAGVQTQRLDPLPEHTLFATERQWVRDALVSAGLAAMAERLPRLAVVHAIANTEAGPQDDPWDGARAWWYLV